MIKILLNILSLFLEKLSAVNYFFLFSKLEKWSHHFVLLLQTNRLNFDQIHTEIWLAIFSNYLLNNISSKWLKINFRHHVGSNIKSLLTKEPFGFSIGKNKLSKNNYWGRGQFPPHSFKSSLKIIWNFHILNFPIKIKF